MVSAAGGPVASSSGVVVLTPGVDELSCEAIDTVLIAGAEPVRTRDRAKDKGEDTGSRRSIELDRSR